jgi:hypothetical protein
MYISVLGSITKGWVHKGWVIVRLDIINGIHELRRNRKVKGDIKNIKDIGYVGGVYPLIY